MDESKGAAATKPKCCGPKSKTGNETSEPVAAPEEKKKSSCCGPKSANVQGSSESGSSSTSGCCKPAQKDESDTSSGCCKPKKEEEKKPSSCCKPAASSCCKPAASTGCKPAASSCCKPASVTPAMQATDMDGADAVKDAVKEYYGKTLSKSGDLKTNACCTSGAPDERLKDALRNVHDEVLAKYYGCGSVELDVIEGARILDLGSGSGRDVYVLSQWVGPEGHVVGVDMTDEQLDVARKHQEYHRERFGYDSSNVTFLKGYIERLEELGLEAGSFDLITSNCVINLCPDKRAVLREAYKLLKTGGMMEFSDVYAERRVPDELRKDPVLWGECLSGALYWGDFENMAVECGFGRPLIVKDSVITIENKAVEAKIGHIRFYSVTYRLTKLEEGTFEASEEDYGQAVVYKGTIDGNEHEYCLGLGAEFITGKITPVSGNVFATLQRSRFAEHFSFYGDTSRHFGPFSRTGRSVPFKSAQQLGAVDTTPVGGDSCCS
ncbi:Arsenite methyltransferase [Hondaea fermentalgiana]|uniref:Arsenite methyltransferase n=1 Tax=Hondaea fermentalgiana TaxID=2315210 RepID=A0A2R5GTJ4_9STRA|nr:Arsenite methyltransferase [Hondaea fermentalgiana]|eukprot:GBG34160.1 Arsenite methyltransferase [Hondaea fermentalgiana]